MKPKQLGLSILLLFAIISLTARDVNLDSLENELLRSPQEGGLFIDGSRKFKVRVLSHLQKLTNFKLDIQLLSGKVIIYGISSEDRKKEFGNELIKNLIYAPQSIRIKYSRDGNNEFIPHSVTKMIIGKPMGGIIHYNPRKRKGGENVKGRNRRPPFIGLAHELIHGYHSIKGVAQMGEMNEECLGYAGKMTMEEHNTRVKENLIRAELNVPARKIPISIACYHDRESVKELEYFFRVVSSSF